MCPISILCYCCTQLQGSLKDKRAQFQKSREGSWMDFVERSELRQETMLLFDTLRRNESIGDIRVSSAHVPRDADTSVARLLHKSFLHSAMREDW